MQHTTKPFDWLKIPATQARQSTDAEADSQFTDSLKGYGMLQPVGAMPDGKLIWGFRRARLGPMAGLKVCPVVILDKEMSETEYHLLQWTENEARLEFKDWERSDFCANLLKMTQWPQSDLAKHLHVSPATVTQLMSVFKCIPAVQEAYRANRLSKKAVYAISQVDPKEQHEILAAKLNGESVETLERKAKKARNGNRDTERVRMSRVRVAMPNDCSVVLTGNDLSMSDVVELLGEVLKEAKKSAETFDVKTWVKMMADKAKV